MEIKISTNKSQSGSLKSLQLSLFPKDFAEMLFEQGKRSVALMDLKIKFDGTLDSGRFTASVSFPQSSHELFVFGICDIQDFLGCGENYDLLREELEEGVWDKDFSFVFGELQTSELICNGGYFRILPRALAVNGGTEILSKDSPISKLGLLDFTILFAGDWSPKREWKGRIGGKG